MRDRILLLAMVSAVMTAEVSAQGPASTVSAGDRVRVTVLGSGSGTLSQRDAALRQIIGSVVAIDDSTLVMTGAAAGAPAHRLSRLAVQRIEQSTGRRSRRGSAAAGMAIGAAAGGLVGLLAPAPCDDPDFFICVFPGDLTTVLVITGGSVGGLVGFAVGGGERWREAQLPARLSLVPRGRRSIGLSASVAF